MTGVEGKANPETQLLQQSGTIDNPKLSDNEITQPFTRNQFSF
jgi:hypothetical protein